MTIDLLRAAGGLLVLALLGGCMTPPKPASCQGEFHPVNAHDRVSGGGSAAMVALCERGAAHGRQG